MPTKRKSAFFAATSEAQQKEVEPDIKTSKDQDAIISDVQEVEMSKRQNTLQSGSQNVKTSKRQNIKTVKDQDVKTSKLPEDMKQQTVYLPKKLALRLKAHAAITEQDISSIITQLVEKYLDRKEG